MCSSSAAGESSVGTGRQLMLRGSSASVIPHVLLAQAARTRLVAVGHSLGCAGSAAGTCKWSSRSTGLTADVRTARRTPRASVFRRFGTRLRATAIDHARTRAVGWLTRISPLGVTSRPSRENPKPYPGRRAPSRGTDTSTPRRTCASPRTRSGSRGSGSGAARVRRAASRP